MKRPSSWTTLDAMKSFGSYGSLDNVSCKKQHEARCKERANANVISTSDARSIIRG